MHAVRARRTPVSSWYMDLTLIGQYWGSERVYHHTAPINMLFALERALGLVLEETLPVRYERHRQHAPSLPYPQQHLRGFVQCVVERIGLGQLLIEGGQRGLALNDVVLGRDVNKVLSGGSS